MLAEKLVKFCTVRGVTQQPLYHLSWQLEAAPCGGFTLSGSQGAHQNWSITALLHCDSWVEISTGRSLLNCHNGQTRLKGSALASSASALELAGIGSIEYGGSFWQLLTKAVPIATPQPLSPTPHKNIAMQTQ